MTAKTAKVLDKVIDRVLTWEQRRDARRIEHWRRNMNRDQRFGIW